MSSAPAYAKINLALVVGARRDDEKHEVVTVLQRIGLHDTITVEPADAFVVDGFAEDTIVRAALESLARAAGREPRWHVHVEKRIPVAAGLGGGSSDAATALALANAQLDEPLPAAELHSLAAGIGADVPFFLRSGAQLGRGDGTELERVEVPTAYSVVVLVPERERKESTAAVYAAYDRREGAGGFAERARAVVETLHAVGAARDLAALPPNDLASSPLARDLEAVGAFRADVSGAGPAVYGLFDDHATAARAAIALARAGRTFVVRPVAADNRP